MEQQYQIYNPAEGIPLESAKEDSKKQRKKYTGNSQYQLGREKEKQELVKYLVDANINGLQQQEADEFVYGIPNAKFNWANLVIKTLFNPNASYNNCDVDMFEYMWLSDKARVVWNTILKPNIKANRDNTAKISARFPTRGKMEAVCRAGKADVQLKNPAIFNMYTGEMEYYPTEEDMLKEIWQWNKYDGTNDTSTGRASQSEIQRNYGYLDELKKLGRNVNSPVFKQQLLESEQTPCECRHKAEIALRRSDKFLSQIDELQAQIAELEKIHSNSHELDLIEAPPHIQSLFNKFRSAIVSNNKVSIFELEKVADALKYLRGIQTSNYLMSIINPFDNRFVKAPSEVPIPTASFSVRTNINLTTNALGNLAFAFDPYFLNAVTATSPSSFGLNNAATLTGLAADNNFNAVSVGQTLPAQLYGKYRLVSAGLKLTVTSSFLQTTGFCTMGLQFDSGASAATNAVTAIPGYTNYGQFSLLENSYFKQQAPLRTGEIIQVNYLPLDNTFLQFISLGTGFRNCTFVGYVTGAPATTTIGRLDIVLNYEGTVDLNWTDYIPQAMSFEPNESAKYLPSAVNYLVDNSKTTSPQDMKLAFDSVIGNDKTDIFISPTRQENNLLDQLKKANSSLVDNLINSMKDILNDKKTSDEQKDKAKSVLDKVLDIGKRTPLAPLAYGIDLVRSIF